MTFNLTLEKVLAYNKQLKKPLYRKCKNISRICSGLYISDWESAMKVSYLTTRKICAVLTINQHEFPPSTLEQYKENKIEHLYIEATDSSESKLNLSFDIGYQFFKNNIKKGGILIHCTMGISRSPTMAIYCITRYFYEYDPYIKT